MKRRPKAATKALKSWAAWWAAVSNVESFDDFSAAEIARLGASYRALRGEPMEAVAKGAPPWDYYRSAPRTLQDVILENLVGRSDFDRTTVRRAHDLARAVILPLLPSTPRSSAEASPAVSVPTRWASEFFRLGSGHIVESQGPAAGPADPAARALWYLFRPGQIFPLRRCPQCGRIFESVGAKRFCNSAHQSRHRDARRKGTTARRDALRRASQAYRERKQEEAERKSRRGSKAASKPGKRGKG